MRASILICASALSLGAAPALAQAPGEPSALHDVSCDRDCLLGHAEDYMQAMLARDVSRLPLSPGVVLTENNVILPVGDGLWRTISAVRDDPMRAADTQTGNVAWFGIIEENGDPAYYALRMEVKAGQITQIEQVVTRLPEPPKPFGDPDVIVRTPQWNDILPEEERRGRERLRAVADGYFNTVERNDGQIFTFFHDECERLENGIATTGTGEAACEVQLSFGIYNINKRIRERRYPLIDEERGIVVASGFFDHDNHYSEYPLNDGRTMQTLLKWPNSISLLEAFRIREGRINLIDAVFTYVPYFMHNPFAAVANPPPPVGERAGPGDCDAVCMTGLAQDYMDALAARTYEDGILKAGEQALPWAERVRFSEQNVPVRIGEGQWASVRAVHAPSLTLADPETGKAVWFGVIEDHGQPAYYGMALTVENGRIADIETLAGRRENPGPFADAGAYRMDPVFSAALPANARTPRADMTGAVNAYYAAVQNGGSPDASFADDCRVVHNGVTLAQDGAEDCASLFAGGGWELVERARDVRVLAVDEARGLVAAIAMLDRPMENAAEGLEIRYPYTTGVLDIFRIENGAIARVEGVSAFLTYGMPAPLGNN